MNTVFVGSWESQFLGLGRLTRFLAGQLPRFSAADDDLGLGVVFLQRHHAEVGLKLLLERVGAGLTTGHRLSALIGSGGTSFSDLGRSAEWDRFLNEQGEYLGLLDEVDPSGFAYRYPVDKLERPVERPPFIDLTALAAAGATFEEAVMRVVDVLARDEVLAVSDVALEPAVQEFAAAVRALRSALSFIGATKPAFSDYRCQLGLPALGPTPDIEAAQTKADAHVRLLARLERPLLRVLDLLSARRSAEARELDLAPAEVPPHSNARPGPPDEMRESLLALEKWIAEGMGRTGRELKRAVRLVHARSNCWSGPAGRQLHSDLGRVLSRL